MINRKDELKVFDYDGKRMKKVFENYYQKVHYKIIPVSETVIVPHVVFLPSPGQVPLNIDFTQIVRKVFVKKEKVKSKKLFNKPVDPDSVVTGDGLLTVKQLMEREGKIW
jgi:hypothetical protein